MLTGRSAPIARKPRPEESPGTGPATPTPCRSYGRRRTTAHPVRAPSRRASRRGSLAARGPLPFFEPADNRRRRDAEGSPEPAQARTLLVDAQDLLLALLRVA